MSAALLLLALAAAEASPAEVATEPSSVLAPKMTRGMTRVQGTVRPFFDLMGEGGGAIGNLSIERYFKMPLKLGLELAPTAFTLQPRGGGSVTHLRIEAAYVTDYLEIGAAIGSRLENAEPGGVSMAGKLRLGALDGLALRLTYSYAVIKNRYTGKDRVAFSNIMGNINVPFTERLALSLDGGFSFDVWLYGTAGLKHCIAGNGGPGSWFVGASFGLAWVLEGFPCQYREPERCEGAAWGMGPTMGFSLEYRF